jgi:hypothetical protein
MQYQAQPETPDMFRELIPRKPFGFTFDPADFVGPYYTEKKELGFIRLLSACGRIIAHINERIPIVTLNILTNAWDVIRTVEYIQNDLQIILSDIESKKMDSQKRAEESIRPLLEIIQQVKNKVVVLKFPNGGADSITKLYDLSNFEGPFQEIESGKETIEIVSNAGNSIAFVSNLVPISARQTLLNSWDNYQTLQAIQQRFVSIFADLNANKALWNTLEEELICLVSDIIAGMELHNA